MLAPVSGLLLGFLDFVWIKYVPAPFGGLGNSIAVWAVAAFLLTFANRWRLPRGVLAAAVQLIVAVPAYYLAATLIQNDDPANMFDANAVIWMGLGLVAAVVFGAGGVLAHRWDAARALPGAVLFAEAVIQLRRLGDPSWSGAELTSYAATLILLGAGISLLITPTWTRRGLVLLWALPLTLGGFVLLHLTGFR
ncbi:hypothetical protein Asi03nite_17610 [Actinoplanes siamensis]|uniref:Uncharacterized protein n=1 Tax=Actinoplanes siamensis TaxID=1223317 RepID=A0A919TIY6_9ACTN|nr:hypothetical protein Asi03nite_17610 [Actinoplanes siamensis]